MSPSPPSKKARTNGQQQLDVAGGLVVSAISCADLKKPVGSISTGVGFLDHMIDQLNSHAQIGISLSVTEDAANPEPANFDNKEASERQETTTHVNTNRFASKDQGALMELVGSKIGTEFKRLIDEKGDTNCGSTSRFCCPLDEALVACQIERRRDPAQQEGVLEVFTLPPYGKFPTGKGRKRIGSMETAALRQLWDGLARHSGLVVRLEKIRGDNAHHIVESAFKAFSRAFRNLLDGTDTVTTATEEAAASASKHRLDMLYGRESSNFREGILQNRAGAVERKTIETSISAEMQLDGGEKGVAIDTGVKTLDDFFSTLAENASMSLQLKCKGDLWIDEHHTAEDVAIAFGQVLAQAVGTKAGLNRMWCSQAVVNDAAVELTMDLSNRPCLIQNLSLEKGHDEMVGDLSLEMFEHVLDSIVVNSRMTCHVVEVRPPGESGHLESTVKAVAAAFGRCLRYCAAVDSRRCGATASSKGTLSV